MEEGSMADWYYPAKSASGDFGGGEYDSDSGVSAASMDIAHSGKWSVKSTLSNGIGGTRLFRWREPRANRSAYFSSWVYFPSNFTLTANPSNGQYFLLYQFKSRSVDGRNDPVWGFYVKNGSDGKMYITPGWGWGGTQIAGPSASDNVSGKFMTSFSKPLPIGQWIHLEAYMRQSKDFDGQVKFWQNGELMFDMNNVRTSYNNCNYNSWCASDEWAVNLYSDGLIPKPSVMYIDDAEIHL